MNAGRRRVLLGAGAAAWVARMDLIPRAGASQAPAVELERMQLNMIQNVPGCYVCDISTDGNELLINCTANPIQLYSLRGGASAQGNGRKRSDELRLIETRTAKVLHRIEIDGAIGRARLTPGQKSGFVSWWGEASYQFGPWDVSSAKPRVLENTPASKAGTSIDPLDPAKALISYSASNNTEVAAEGIVIVGLPRMERLFNVLSDPSDQNASTSYAEFSRDRKCMAYSLSGSPSRIVVRATEDLRLAAHITPAPGQGQRQLALSSDGAMLAVDVFVGTTGQASDPRAVHEVFIYDVASGVLLNRLPIDGRHGVAFSADGRLLAAGRKSVKQGAKLRVQAIVSIHDLKSGRKLGEVTHPEVVEPRKNPFIGNLLKIGFSSDDRLLVTSTTQETRVWSVDRG